MVLKWVGPKTYIIELSLSEFQRINLSQSGTAKWLSMPLDYHYRYKRCEVCLKFQNIQIGTDPFFKWLIILSENYWLLVVGIVCTSRDLWHSDTMWFWPNTVTLSFPTDFISSWAIGHCWYQTTKELGFCHKTNQHIWLIITGKPQTMMLVSWIKP
jgi:hypothetical protein